MEIIIYPYRELDVTACPITDAGIEGLCVSTDKFGREDQMLGQCKLIQKLIMKETRVTKKGIQMALVNLSALKIIQYDSAPSVVQILAAMHQAAFKLKQPDVSSYSLTELNCRHDSLGSPFVCGSLVLVTSLCPAVIKVNIETQHGLSDVDFLGLLSLKSLRELKIVRGTTGCQITFDGGLAPLLEAQGHSLYSLELVNLHDIDLGTTIKLCPNLCHLSLWWNMFKPIVDEQTLPNPVKPILKSLVSLNLVDIFSPGTSGEGAIASEHLFSLLSSPSLMHLTVGGCEALTDQVFRNTAKLHDFQKLEYLDICDCPNVTRRGIDFLMSENNPLKMIKYVSRNKPMRKRDVNEWKENAASNNWKLELKM